MVEATLAVLPVRRLAEEYVSERLRRKEIAPTTAITFRETLRLFAIDIAAGRATGRSPAAVRAVERPAGREGQPGDDSGQDRHAARLLPLLRPSGRHRAGRDDQDPAPKLPRRLPRAVRPALVGAAIQQAVDEREKLMILLMAEEPPVRSRCHAHADHPERVRGHDRLSPPNTNTGSVPSLPVERAVVTALMQPGVEVPDFSTLLAPLGRPRPLVAAGTRRLHP